MKPKPTTEKPGILTTKTIKPGKFGGHISLASFGSTETHRVNVIEFKPADRAALLQIAKRYRVRNPGSIIGRSLGRRGRLRVEHVLFRMYED